MNRTATSSNKEITNLAIVYGLILIGIIARLLPHPANFAPISALALFSGAYLSKKNALIIPLIAMFISDIFLGFHTTMPFVYLSFILIALLGQTQSNKIKFTNILALSLSGSLLFFIITNFGVWATTHIYGHTLQGLIDCYTLAIPFYRNTLLGDLVYTGAFFGLYEFAKVTFLNKQLVKKTVNN